jgi:hypothetical protein
MRNLLAVTVDGDTKQRDESLVLLRDRLGAYPSSVTIRYQADNFVADYIDAITQSRESAEAKADALARLASVLADAAGPLTKAAFERCATVVVYKLRMQVYFGMSNDKQYAAVLASVRSIRKYEKFFSVALTNDLYDFEQSLMKETIFPLHANRATLDSILNDFYRVALKKGGEVNASLAGLDPIDTVMTRFDRALSATEPDLGAVRLALFDVKKWMAVYPKMHELRQALVQTVAEDSIFSQLAVMRDLPSRDPVSGIDLRGLKSDADDLRSSLTMCTFNVLFFDTLMRRFGVSARVRDRMSGFMTSNHMAMQYKISDDRDDDRFVIIDPSLPYVERFDYALDYEKREGHLTPRGVDSRDAREYRKRAERIVQDGGVLTRVSLLGRGMHTPDAYRKAMLAAFYDEPVLTSFSGGLRYNLLMAAVIPVLADFEGTRGRAARELLRRLVIDRGDDELYSFDITPILDDAAQRVIAAIDRHTAKHRAVPPVLFEMLTYFKELAVTRELTLRSVDAYDRRNQAVANSALENEPLLRGGIDLTDVSRSVPAVRPRKVRQGYMFVLQSMRASDVKTFAQEE